jgi:hypothetical protein
MHGGAVFQPPIIHLEVVEPIFLPGVFGGWETAAPFVCGSAAVCYYRSESCTFATIFEP